MALAAVAYAATTVMDIPPPYRLYQLEVAEPSRRGELFPAREVAAPAVPWALPAQPEPPPATVPWKGGQIAFDRFLELTHTNAFVILRDGKLAMSGTGPASMRARRCPRGPCPSHWSRCWSGRPSPGQAA